jgi:hypothetical protein
MVFCDINASDQFDEMADFGRKAFQGFTISKCQDIGFYRKHAHPGLVVIDGLFEVVQNLKVSQVAT